MSRFGTILGGTANAVGYVVQGATPEVLLAASGAAGLKTFGMMRDPVVTSITLTGAGDGHMFFLEVEGAESVNADGGIQANSLSGQVFLGADAETLTAELLSVQNTSPVVDVQIAGAAKGQRVMGIVICGTLRGGGGGGLDFLSRVDCSVNAAYVQDPYGATPILHTRSSGQVAGGYNGVGTGNKSILGFNVPTTPLGSLQSLEYTWLSLNPTVFSAYGNLILDVNGDGSAYRIAVIDPAFSPLLHNGTTVSNPDGSKTTKFNAATDALVIVNGLPGPPLPPGAGFVPQTYDTGAPPPLPGGWQHYSWSIPAILAPTAYPACRIIAAASGDNGLPKSPNVTPGFLLCTGDSNNQMIAAYKLSNVKFNGARV